MNKPLCAALILTLLSAAPQAFAQDAPPPRPGFIPPGQEPPQDRNRHDRQPDRRDHRPPVDDHAAYQRGFDQGARFHDPDRGRFHDWYSRYPRYYRPVPPGVMAQLRVEGYLPRGYYARAPQVVVRDLPPLPPGYGYYTVGTNLVIAAVTTGLIIDLLADR